MIQQTAGFTMAATSLSRVDWGGEWKAGSDNIAQLAKAAGYAAGAFNPLIFAATGAADALGNIIDAAAQKRLDRAAAEANRGIGFGPGGNPLRTSEELQKEYERQRELLPGRYESPADFIKRIRKAQAEAEGLDRIFTEAGFEWRSAGCSMCLGMNPDQLAPGERCASTSNRNFEGRQGAGGRTHLVSPAMAAAAAVHGHFVDIRKFS